MKKYIVKSLSGTFAPGTQPEGFHAISAIENRLFICACPEIPHGDFVIEFPEEQQADFLYYHYSNGKRLWFDPFDGKVVFGNDIDNKNRRAIQYDTTQLATQLRIMKWLMLSVWIPDKKRIYSIPDDIVATYHAQVDALTDSATARTYITKNLYYNL
jgi:hypothetical protein